MIRELLYLAVAVSVVCILPLCYFLSPQYNCQLDVKKALAKITNKKEWTIVLCIFYGKNLTFDSTIIHTRANVSSVMLRSKM